MIRFALTVTAVEFVLTVAASLYLASSLDPEPFLSEADLRSVGLDCETLDTAKRVRFEVLHSYDSNAILKNAQGSVWTGVRPNATTVDFDLRRGREHAWMAKPEHGIAMVIDDSFPGEAGYSVRHRSSTGVRSEVVHLRGDRMLIVRVSRMGPFEGTPDEEVSRAERRAHLVFGLMAAKLGWRD